MSEKAGLKLLEFLASGIDRDDPAIRAVLSDENGEGATANELEALAAFIDYYTRTDDARDHRGKTLEILAGLFARQRRRLSESDEILSRRFLALTGRNGDVVWGNALNMKSVFEAYFPGVACYVAENTGENNVLDNGDFESDAAWALGGGAIYSGAARFSGGRGVFLGGAGGEHCVQALERIVPEGNHAFHFFLRGKCGVVIENDGKYWNANDQRFSGDAVLEWMDNEVVNVFESRGEWGNVHCFVVLPEDTRGLSVKFVGLEGEEACVDYARLFAKPLNPSFTLVFQYEGYSISEETLRLAKDGEDPIEGVDYENESYFDRAFIVGPAGVSGSQAFWDVMDIVRPRGVQAFAEFIGVETEGNGTSGG